MLDEEHFFRNERMKHAEHNVRIDAQDVTLSGTLQIPSDAKAIVIFVHGSGSSRFSPRNQYVAKILRENKIATLLFDLLTVEEEQVDMETAHLRFDIELLAKRLKSVTQWIQKNPKTKDMAIGYFGASTGAAAALVAAADQNSILKSIVSRGGRPDLAGKFLKFVKAPTLLIVGGKDDVVITLNQQAFEKLNTQKKLVIIPDATHLFEEKGALEKVAEIASIWFKETLFF